MFHEELLTMEQVTKELHMDVNESNMRSNVDSAKKRACLQHMDYEGFRQMVLGAHLFPLKAGEAASIVKGGFQPRTDLNPTAAYE
jgi:hypothetical protein